MESKHRSDNRDFWCPFYRDEFHNWRTIREAIWLLMLFVHRTTRERCAKDGTVLGSVSGGAPQHDNDLAVIIGCSRHTIMRWREVLVRAGRIQQRRTPLGYVIEVVNSRKIVKRSASKKADAEQTGMSHVANPHIGDVANPHIGDGANLKLDVANPHSDVANPHIGDGANLKLDVANPHSDVANPHSDVTNLLHPIKKKYGVSSEETNRTNGGKTNHKMTRVSVLASQRPQKAPGLPDTELHKLAEGMAELGLVRRAKLSPLEVARCLVDAARTEVPTATGDGILAAALEASRLPEGYKVRLPMQWLMTRVRDRFRRLALYPDG